MQRLQVGQTTLPQLLAAFGRPASFTARGEGWNSLLWYQGFDLHGTHGSSFEMLEVELTGGSVGYYSCYDGESKVRSGTSPPVLVKYRTRLGSHISTGVPMEAEHR